ncbi:MAG: hypothetical protein A2921_04710 [Candidatus Magasanikbacteria bacterium RIFCSPLOWO2_01_FULL_43_20b]|uniref:Uncharacterized protein n=1 Tax=Candidatus Magasanikbacteria bacterium RIFCSPLOWO2_12_FULL_43_12 TaxID=1798692 RepID=A0A1F6MRY0_9BACT|nr:MAG: hypothetical protein A3C74_00440 [Candidatus Magasanikbacteria bacterium RIFCSPHIGHO2_02_FULL_44_13]OGH71773.1 MAG: hypothetical protein A3I93_01720 [Candidatus Magasanikbacteria bacterium RIFCSPLOWO2_02_FULL_43_22]OGH73086.1 MAG: hypothetical protein A2921_04710 [Candidatus Magasanikbacteria bacterium RIFCSPLOWO2_01_FULL_43_20b]OGH74416.1 MAG: hypothetical protein A3G00_00980 [Candidatus Magasanikbacteria bacterium RIFCSPLOWO2_12_FULL_43_12]
MENNSKLNETDWEKPVTYGQLLEYTDSFLLPRINEAISLVVKDANANLENRLKSYIDDKLADYTSDIFKRLEKKDIKEKEFKRKVVELFKRHDIGTTEDLAFLDGLAI